MNNENWRIEALGMSKDDVVNMLKNSLKLNYAFLYNSISCVQKLEQQLFGLNDWAIGKFREENFDTLTDEKVEEILKTLAETSKFSCDTNKLFNIMIEM